MEKNKLKKLASRFVGHLNDEIACISYLQQSNKAIDLIAHESLKRVDYNGSIINREIEPVNKELQNSIEKNIHANPDTNSFFMEVFLKLQELDPFIAENFNNNTIGFIFEFEDIYDVKVNINDIDDLYNFIQAIDDSLSVCKHYYKLCNLNGDIETLNKLVSIVERYSFEFDSSKNRNRLFESVKSYFIKPVSFEGKWKWN